jgi:rhamnosyl/mannosyltransferase
MHILHVYKTYATETMGGVEQLIRQLGHALVPRGVKVSVATLSRAIQTPDVIDDQGITVHRYPLSMELASNGISFSMLRDFRRLASQADVLNYHFPWPTGDLIHQLAPPKIPAIVTYHSDIVRQKWLKRFYGPLMHRFLGQVDAIVATSPTYAATSPVLQHYAAKTRAIPIGLDEASYAVPSATSLARWKDQLPPDFFLFVGVLRYYKGLPTLIEAARRTGLPIVIAGKGPEEAALKAQAADVPNVIFVGGVQDDDKMALLQLCRGFVFPSHVRSEAFGISLLEAAMCGKPMISCEIGSGMSYINIAEETGIAVPPLDVGAFATAMQRLAGDPLLAQRLGAASRQRFEALFTAEKMAESYATLYREVAGQN